MAIIRYGNEYRTEKGHLEIGRKTEVLLRVLYKLGGTATLDQIYNNIPIDTLKNLDLNKKRVMDLMYNRDPFYINRKFKSWSYMKNGNGRHQVYILKQRVIDWFRKQDAGLV